MKRSHQCQKVTDFIAKIRKVDVDNEEYEDEEDTQNKYIKYETVDQVCDLNNVEVIIDEDEIANKNCDIPDCWTEKQANDFKEKYHGLLVVDKRLGCDICAQVDGIKLKAFHVSKEWKACTVVACGKNKTVRQASLRKKIKEHFSSKSHEICATQLKDSEDAIIKSIEVSKELISSTSKVFNTIYTIAKQNRPFSDVESLLELQKKNGLHIGVNLHSRHTVIKIVDHIAKHIKRQIFDKIIEQNLKICIIIGEASTISHKPVLMIFVKVEDNDFSPTVFVDLVELLGQDAETIYTSLCRSMQSVGFDNQYLKKNLIEFCSDGASVMLGQSGVSSKMKHDYPEIVVSHCLSRRLQLVLDDSIKDTNQANHFKSLIDEIYKRNRLKVRNVANLLVINLIGLPLERWDCTDSVREWLMHHNGADDPTVINSSEKVYDENRRSIWTYLCK